MMLIRPLTMSTCKKIKYQKRLNIKTDKPRKKSKYEEFICTLLPCEQRFISGMAFSICEVVRRVANQTIKTKKLLVIGLSEIK